MNCAGNTKQGKTPVNGLIELLNRAAEAWWPQVLHATWQCSLLAGVILGALRLGRRWPAQMRYALGLLALVKFIVPASFSTPMGLFSMPGPTFDPSVWSAHSPLAGEFGGNWAAGPSAWALGPLNWQAWLMVLHVMGAIAVGALMAVHASAIARLARNAESVTTGPLWSQFRQTLGRVGLRGRVRLLVSARAVTPMAIGTLRRT